MVQNLFPAEADAWLVGIEQGPPPADDAVAEHMEAGMEPDCQYILAHGKRRRTTNECLKDDTN